MNRLEKSFFSTASVPVENRFNAWRDSISVLFDVSEPGTPDPDFNASLDSYLINGHCMLARCQASAQRFERHSLQLARDGLDYYLIQIMISGSQQVRRGNQEVAFEPGSIMVIDLAGHHLADVQAFNNLSLVIPRHLLSPMLHQPDSQGGRVIHGDDPLAAIAVSHMNTLFATMDSMSSDQAAHIITPTLSLLASVLNGSADSVEAGHSSVGQSLLLRAKHYIENHLHSSLTVEKLSMQLALSKASLHRLFESAGGVRSYIQERRLRRCAEALVSPEYSSWRIYDIAYSWGFKSEAHFSRAFRQRFSVSPREARQVYLAMKQGGHDSWAGQTEGRDYERWLSETLRS